MVLDKALSSGSSGPNPRRWQVLALAILLLILMPAHSATVLGPWVPLFEGIDHAVGTNTSSGGGMPDLMVINALRVDLTDTNVQLYAAPRIATDYSMGYIETGGYTTSNFLTMHGLQAAINANYFHDPGRSSAQNSCRCSGFCKAPRWFRHTPRRGSPGPVSARASCAQCRECPRSS